MASDIVQAGNASDRALALTQAGMWQQAARSTAGITACRWALVPDKQFCRVDDKELDRHVFEGHVQDLAARIWVAHQSGTKDH